MKYNQMRQVVFPILAAFIWGTAFVAQDLCADSIGAFAFNATRYFIAVLALLVVILISDKLKKNKPTLTAQEKKAANKQLWLGGLCCGAALAIASNFQQAGLVAGTDAGKAGFITALYVILVPVFVCSSSARSAFPPGSPWCCPWWLCTCCASRATSLWPPATCWFWCARCASPSTFWSSTTSPLIATA